MLKFGIISEIDVANGLARVTFNDDGFVSAPLKMAVARSGTDKVSFPFDINEHVYCLMDENMEFGVIAGAVYDESNKPPSNAGKGKLVLSFADNSTIIYDRNLHTLSIDIKGKTSIKCDQAEIEATATVSIKAPQTTIDGILTVTGAAAVNGVLSMGGMAGIGGAPIPGSTAELSVKKVTATDDVIADNIGLKTHKHTSAASGSPTSTPIP